MRCRAAYRSGICLIGCRFAGLKPGEEGGCFAAGRRWRVRPSSSSKHGLAVVLCSIRNWALSRRAPTRVRVCQALISLIRNDSSTPKSAQVLTTETTIMAVRTTMIAVKPQATRS